MSTDPWEDDEKLFALLAEHGFQGEEYWKFERHVGAFTLSLLQRWMLSGEIFTELRRAGQAFTPSAAHRERLRQSPMDREDLACRAVGAALMRFRRTKGAGWSPTGGASLKTYFVRSALWAFRDAYEAWGKQEVARDVPWEPEVVDRAAEQHPNPAWSHRTHDRRDQDPEKAYLDKEMREELLRGANLAKDDAVQQIYALRESGHKDVEIEQLLGLKAGAVGRLIRRNAKRGHPDG